MKPMGWRIALWMLVVSLCSAEEKLPPAPPLRSQVEAALALGERAASARKLHVVLLADKKDHGLNEHDYPLWQQRWAFWLGGRAVSDAKQVNLFGPAIGCEKADVGAENLEVACAQGWPTDDQFAHADLIVAFCYLSWDEARKQQIRRYLDRGGGVVVIHSATWTKPKPDPEVAALLGVGGFTRYRHGPVQLEIVGDHPIVRGLPRQLSLVDETYWAVPPQETKGMSVLAVSQEEVPAGQGASAQPMAWLAERGRGRVMGMVLGHYVWTFDDPWFRLLVVRGMAWAAGEPVNRFDPLVLRAARVTEK